MTEEVYYGPRVYKCDVCGREHLITTNHDTGPVSEYCGNCSWRSGYGSTGAYYRADINKYRPQHFVRRADDADIRDLPWARN